ncbi:MAG: cysteine desulfurase [Clostridiales bacterium]|nr:cysteine desulfurase [Clostridiales bacterium]
MCIRDSNSSDTDLLNKLCLNVFNDIQNSFISPQLINELALEYFPEFFSSEPLLNKNDVLVPPVFIPDCSSQYNEPDVYRIRQDFPILSEMVNGMKLIWFDNAATTQKPKCVIDRLVYFYEHENSNVHRSSHTLAERTTDAYEGARNEISKFINASSVNEIIFVRGTTEAINLIAQTYGKHFIHRDDEIIVSQLEHHSNIVPWQIICSQTGAKLRVIPVDETGQIDLEEYQKLLNEKTKLVAVTHVSNSLGTIVPVKEITHMAHQYGAKVLIDGAQAISHLKVDVKNIDCDFYAFSGHKIYGPTGIGVLYTKADIMNDIEPYQGGGNMISDVSFEKSSYQSLPHRYEAGTGSIADAIGLGEAIHYVDKLGINNITNYEKRLLENGIELLRKIPGLKIIGGHQNKTGILPFVIDGFSADQIGKALSSKGIAVRAGHHCAQPIIRRFGLESSVRISLAFYNTLEEISYLESVLREIIA